MTSSATEAGSGPRPTKAPVPRRVKWFIYLLAPSAISYGFLLVWITAYLVELGLGSDVIGLLLGVSGAGLVIGSLPLAVLADRIGKKRVLLPGLYAFVPTIAVFALTTDVTVMLVASGLAGLLEGTFLATWNAMIADQTTVENRDSAFALSFIMGTLAIGAGYAIPFAFPFLEASLGVDSRTIHTIALLAVAAISVVSPVGLTLLLRDYAEPGPGSKRLFRGRNLGLLWKFSGYNALIGLGAGFIIPLIPTWLFLKFDAPDSFSGPLLAISGVTMALAATASPSLSRRYGNVRAIVLTQGLSTIFMLALAFTPTALVAGGVYIVRALLMNMSVPLADSFVMGIVTHDQRSFASAVNSLIWRLPNSVSTVVGGALLAAGAFQLPFFLAVALYCVGIALFFVFFRNVTPTT